MQIYIYVIINQFKKIQKYNFIDMNKQKHTGTQVIITEQQKQNDPIMKYIRKKIRNLNKKLTDIEVLEKKIDLKPEQIQKIKNKLATLQEKKKYEDFVTIYKQILKQTAPQRKQQSEKATKATLDQFQKTIATVLALGKSNITADKIDQYFNFKFRNEVKSSQLIYRFALPPFTPYKPFNLIPNIQQYQNQPFRNYYQNVQSTLQELSLRQVEINNCYQANKNQIQSYQINIFLQPSIKKQPKINTQPQKVVQAQKPEVDIIQNEKSIQNLNTTPITLVNPIVTPVIQPVVQQIKKQQNIIPQEVSKTVEESSSNQQTQPIIQKPTENGTVQTPNEQKIETQPKKFYKKPYQPRNDYRNNEKGEYKPRKYDNRKPKYNEKKDDTSLSSQEEREYQRREFNHNQIKQLQEQGFIVVPTKQKAKEQEEYHRKQHGFKDRDKKHHH